MASRVAGRRRWPTIEEVEPIIARLPGDLEVFARVALWSGLRLSEVAALAVDDVEFYDDGKALLHVRAGKGNVEGWSLLYEPGCEALKAAMGYAVFQGVNGVVVTERRKMTPGRALLRNSERQPWNRKSVNKRWVAARKLVDGQEATKFHTLRAIHATWLLDRGVPELDVAMQLRHIDKDGHPNVELVRKVYGKPSVDAVMDRLRLVDDGGPFANPDFRTSAGVDALRRPKVAPSSAESSFPRALAEVPPPAGMSQEEWDAIVAEVSGERPRAGA